jgi:hypothetical protein
MRNLSILFTSLIVKEYVRPWKPNKIHDDVFEHWRDGDPKAFAHIYSIE